MRVSSGACPHHFSLTDQCLRTFDGNFKMAPPLRTQNDIEAIIKGLKDGVRGRAWMVIVSGEVKEVGG